MGGPAYETAKAKPPEKDPAKADSSSPKTESAPDARNAMPLFVPSAAATETKHRQNHGMGVSVVDLINRDCPTLFTGIDQEALDGWQNILDITAENKHMAIREDQITKRYAHLYPDSYQYLSDYQDAIHRVWSRQRTDRVHSDWVSIEPGLLLSDDVMATPQWNIAAEQQFRAWLREQFLSAPLNAELDLKQSSPHITLWWRGVVVTPVNGLITFAELMRFPDFSSKYKEEVQNSPLVTEVNEGLDLVEHTMNHAKYEHKDRSDSNRPGGEGYFDSVHRVMARYYRKTAEFIGHGSAPYPILTRWQEPDMYLHTARQLYKEGKFELAAAVLNSAAEKADEVEKAFYAYEGRVTSGVGRIVGGLKFLRFTGKLAASLLPGGTVTRALYTGAESVLQETGSQGMEVYTGARASVDFGQILKEGAVDSALSIISELTVGKFTEGLQIRFGAQLAKQFGPDLAEHIIATGAVATAAPWNAATQIVINRLVLGEVSINNLDDLGNLITSQVVSDVGMQFLMHPISKAMHGSSTADNPGDEAAPPTKTTPAPVSVVPAETPRVPVPIDTAPKTPNQSDSSSNRPNGGQPPLSTKTPYRLQLKPGQVQIADSNVAIALDTQHALDSGVKPQDLGIAPNRLEKSIADRTFVAGQLTGENLQITHLTHSTEFTDTGHQTYRDFAVAEPVDPTTAEHRDAIYKTLLEHNMGTQNKTGDTDIRLVRQVLLTQTPTGEPPILVTADNRIINGLARLASEQNGLSGVTAKGGYLAWGKYQNAADYLYHEHGGANVFEVNVEGHHLIVRPIQQIYTDASRPK